MDEEKHSEALAKLIARAKRHRGLHRREASPAPPASVYDGLYARYERAYAAASALKGLAVLNIVVGGLVVVAGIAVSSKHSFVGVVGGLPILAWGGAAILTGIALNAVASILTVLIDRTAFTAPGLSDQERINLVFTATGHVPPRMEPEQSS